MTRRVLVFACAIVAALLLLPASGLAARAKAPVVTSIAPKKLGVGEILTIKGRNFVPGKFKNVVVFQRARSRAVFMSADTATAKKIKITITAKLQPFLSQRGGQVEFTRFKIRVLARRLGAAFTPNRLSPLIGPSTGNGSAPTPSGDCDHDGIPNSVEEDDDGDLVPDSEEIRLKMNPCNPDSDGDGMEDGWEYYSALDLNSRAVPYPGKRPYPNPLDGTDAKLDHDGDGLTQTQEYTAWVRYGNHRLLTPEESTASRLLYSDGEQTSFNEDAQIAAHPWLDIDGDGHLSDDERDADKDGLGNWVEANGPGVLAWWTTIYQDEKPYTTPYPELDWLDADTDGDGVLDGDDDQDHDDFSNIQETVGVRAGPSPLGFFGLRGNDWWIQPYNPCLPNYRSRTCAKHPPMPTDSYPPFDDKTPHPLPSLPYGGDSLPALHWKIDW
ncbi:MAG: hypothetical protein QOE65_321 [Solirubrobacteraceae bacterium]|jgi:hypothetical protein|nr:hypothetical protein [Solirubrobacteraceae bacterium]